MLRLPLHWPGLIKMVLRESPQRLCLTRLLKTGCMPAHCFCTSLHVALSATLFLAFASSALLLPALYHPPACFALAFALACHQLGAGQGIHHHDQVLAPRPSSYQHGDQATEESFIRGVNWAPDSDDDMDAACTLVHLASKEVWRFVGDKARHEMVELFLPIMHLLSMETMRTR
jgi:hypothetical protein